MSDGAPILIVDDNASNTKLLAFLLTSKGYRVRTAANAPEALAVLEEFRPRLILMDIQLPGMDGLTLTKQLKADPRTSGILIIAATAYAMKGDAERVRAAGCDGYITKPIDTRRLPHDIERYLAS
jgi:CheY-like chemotaxis protein